MRLVRRLVVRRCEEVRARRMQRRRRVWLQVRLWWHLEDRLRRLLVLLVLQRRLLVPDLRRWLRLLARRVAQQCCLVEAARRKHLVRRARLCDRQVDQRQPRQLQRVRPWSEVVGQLWRRVLRRLRLLVLVVRMHRRCRRRLGERLDQRWLLMVDQCLTRLVRRVLQHRMREHLWTQLLRLLGRQLVLRLCRRAATSRMR